MSRTYMVEEITDVNAFLNLKEEWNKLVFKDPNSTIFQTWEWNYRVWEYDRDGSKGLIVLLVREKSGDLAGIAPFYSYKRKVLGVQIRVIELIGKGFTDYGGFIVKPENNTQVHAEILSWLNENSKEWDVVDLHHLSEESYAVKSFDSLLGDFNFRTVIQKENICPYMTLYPNRGFYENLHNRTLVKYLKRKTRKLEKDLNYKTLTISSSFELDGYLDKLFDLHKKRRNQKLQLGLFHSEGREQFFTDLSHDLLKRGWLKLFFLLVDDRPAACLYNFEFKNKVYFYQSGLDPNPEFAKYSLGYITHYLAIGEALKRGMGEYDFLLGDENYKREWTENYRALYRVKIVPSDSKKAVFFNVNEQLLSFFYSSRFYKSKLMRKLYFSLKNLLQGRRALRP